MEKLTIRLIPEPEGGYTVLVDELPGCVSVGETKEEAIRNIAEAIALYWEVVEESEERR